MDKKTKEKIGWFGIILLVVALLTGAFYPVWIEKSIIIDILLGVVCFISLAILIKMWGP